MVIINNLSELGKMYYGDEECCIKLPYKVINILQLENILNDDNFKFTIFEKEYLKTISKYNAHLILDDKNNLSVEMNDDYVEICVKYRGESYTLLSGANAIEYLISIINDNTTKSYLESIFIDTINISKYVDLEIYRMILYRSIRVRCFEKDKVPKLIITNEINLLQKVVNNLFSN